MNSNFLEFFGFFFDFFFNFFQFWICFENKNQRFLGLSAAVSI